jgi:hypothetical protein
LAIISGGLEIRPEGWAPAPGRCRLGKVKRNPTKGLNPEKMMEIFLVAQVLENEILGYFGRDVNKKINRIKIELKS